MAFQAALLYSGCIVPSVTIVVSNSIYPSIVGSFKPYHDQFSASTHQRAALVGTIVQQRKLLVICRIKPDTWRLQLLLDDRCRLSCFRTMMYIIQQTEQIPSNHKCIYKRWDTLKQFFLKITRHTRKVYL